MFVMSYVIIVAFHPHFNFDRIIVQRSICHLKEEMTSVNYLSREQFEFRHPELIKQLYDQAIRVLKKISDNELAIMFNIELAFLKKLYLNGLIKKLPHHLKDLTIKLLENTKKNFVGAKNENAPFAKCLYVQFFHRRALLIMKCIMEIL